VAQATPPAAPQPPEEPGNIITQPPRRPARLPRSWLAIGAAAAAVIVCGGAGTLAVWLLVGALKNTETTLQRDAERYRFRFDLPDERWVEDPPTQHALSASYAMRRRDVSCWLAFFAHDYGKEAPPERELLDETLVRLHAYFKELEWEPIAGADLGARTGRRLRFFAKAAGEDVAGECTFVSRQGAVYWFVTWGLPEDADRLAHEWEGVRRRFTILGE
jgi:hypothetical protein